MNFLRGVMGGQSAGPQHTEAETVRGARWVRDFGRVRAGTGRKIRGPGGDFPRPAVGWGFACCLSLCLPFSAETPELFPYAPSAAPPPRGVSARLTAAAPQAPQARRGGWSSGSAARQGLDSGHRWLDLSPVPLGASGPCLLSPVSPGREEPEVLLPPSQPGIGHRGRLQGLKPSC